MERQPTKKKIYLLPNEVKPALTAIDEEIDLQLKLMNKKLDLKNYLTIAIFVHLQRLDELTERKTNIETNNNRF